MCLNFSLIFPLLFFSGFKCPVCSKSVASNEMEVHFIMCLSKPRLSYNGKEQRLCLFLPLPFLYMKGGYRRSGSWAGKPGSLVCQRMLNRFRPWFFKIVYFFSYLLVFPILCGVSCHCCCADKYSRQGGWVYRLMRVVEWALAKHDKYEWGEMRRIIKIHRMRHDIFSRALLKTQTLLRLLRPLMAINPCCNM